MLQDLTVYQKTYAFVKWLIPKTQQFPKSQRFTMAQRIDTLALDILELVIDANERRNIRAGWTIAPSELRQSVT